MGKYMYKNMIVANVSLGWVGNGPEGFFRCEVFKRGARTFDLCLALLKMANLMRVLYGDL